jgi:hypothetical protein
VLRATPRSRASICRSPIQNRVLRGVAQNATQQAVVDKLSLKILELQIAMALAISMTSAVI